MAPKARILCLHGYAQNAEFFRARTGALRKALKAVAEFHFVDAPHPATAEFLGEVPEERGAALGWFNVGETAPGARPAISTQYVGVEATLECIRAAVEEHGPFDGVLGFSQGATMAAYCCLRPETWWKAGAAPPFRFAILFSAFLPRDPAWSLVAAEPSKSLPTFHCFGQSDDRVPPKSCLAVAACFDAPRHHPHEGGHGVPSDAPLRAALKEFISSCQGDGGGEGAAVSAAGAGAGSSGAGGDGGGGKSRREKKAARSAWSEDEAGRFLRTHQAWQLLRA